MLAADQVWNAVDAVAAGVPSPKSTHSERATESNSNRPHFVVNDRGVWFHDFDDAGEAKPTLWICSELTIDALTRDGAGKNWGRLLAFKDRDGNAHQWAMPMELLKSDGSDLRGELLRQGLEIASGMKARQKLTEYIQSARTGLRALSVDRIGWHVEQFVLPHCTLGSGQEVVIYQSASGGEHSFAASGSLDGWRADLAMPCAGNSRLVFGVCCALAPPLLHVLGEESGGFHLRGNSSTGKTTVLNAAASVWGSPDYVQRWRATTNGLEGIAKLHSDVLLILDELAQVDPREAGEIAYMLANGHGKSRAGRDGNARRSARWRLLFLSAGEIGLADHMREAGKRVRAGQEIRMVDIPADTGSGGGVFDTVTTPDEGKVYSEQFKEAARTHYGHAGPAFVTQLTQNLGELPEWLKVGRAEFTAEVCSSDAGGQVQRVASRFAVVAMAGELATHYGLTGWTAGEATQAAKTCFAAWIEARGGAGNQEAAAILAQVARIIEQHGDSRFADLDGDGQRTVINRMGFRRNINGSTEYLVLPQSFKAEVCAGFDPKSVARVLLDAAWLMPDSDGKPAQKCTLPDLGRPRVYVISPKEVQ